MYVNTTVIQYCIFTNSKTTAMILTLYHLKNNFGHDSESSIPV